MRKLIAKLKKHKIMAVILILILIAASFMVYNKFKSGNIQISYITAAAEKGTLIVSVSSSGQISASNQVDIMAKVSGDITKIAVTSGQEVKAGGLIAQIDATEAYKTVRDAQTNLQSAQLAMDKLKQAVDANSVLQAQNAVTSAQNNLDKLKLSQPIDYQNAQNNLRDAQAGLDKSYTDAFNSISSVFLNLPNIITALKDILYSEQISASDTSLSQGQINTSILLNSTFESDQLNLRSYQAMAEADYASAQTAYDDNYQNFKTASVYSDPAVIKKLVDETLAAVKAITQAIKSENNYLITWSDFRSLRNWPIFTQATTYKNNLATYAGQNNSNLSNMLSAQNAIISGQSSVVSANDNLKALVQNQPLDLAAAENSLKEKQSALTKLLAGADPLDIRSQELSLQQKRNALDDAQTALADYTVKAPFDGIMAVVNVKVGDSVGSSGLATIVTKQQIAEISLNELDAAKIKLGQKAIMTFDAIDDLEITGQVAEIDVLGAVSQGVVTYNVKLIFDTQTSRIKSGMSANATIITAVKTDVLMAQNSAVKTDANGDNYVQILDSTGQPQNVPIQIGLANDTDAEVVSGLSQGDKVITQTISSGGTMTSTQTSSSANRNSGGFGGLRIPGLGGGR